ncbi:class I SAM-dependent RNA methyltransferase [Mycoplasmopsis gallinacea]|uniref:Hypothetical RNA methyltransferase n=1 Tax=Mycoplasmopsis gallinacea TaxID=29556 RepID=A0A449A3L2_9BACT|nr:methyltransferase domain-containing protein [Mycoplasmopsis gallinacea]VEU58835.1 Hypothetical RNA methyltransferase [Mycoplasmopsis gallinacea]
MNNLNNQVLTLKIEKITYEGLGQATLENGHKIFVYNAFTNEVVKAKIIKSNSKFSFALVEEFIEQNKSIRNEKSYNCVSSNPLINLRYEYQIELKQHYLQTLFLRNLNLDPNVLHSFYGAKNIYNYRNKATYPLFVDQNKLRYGEYRAKSNILINTDNLVLNQKSINQVLLKIVNLINLEFDHSHLDNFKEIILKTNNNNETIVCLKVIGQIDFSDHFLSKTKEIRNLIQFKIVNLDTSKEALTWTKKSFIISLLNKKFSVLDKSFFQINNEIASIMFSKIKEKISSLNQKVIVDLFCGVGTIGQLVSEESMSIFGVDIEEQSIFLANKNALKNNFTKAFYEAEDVFKSKELEKHLNSDDSFVILDPPRSGLNDALIDLIAKKGVKNIAYMSCDPRTLVRDLKRFTEVYNYKIDFVQGFDMFPNTYHIETIVFMHKND